MGRHHRHITRWIFAALVASLFLAGPAAADSITLDGAFDGGGAYTNSFTASWYNGHKTDESIYGDATTPLGTTTVFYEYSGGSLFVYVAAPLAAKNMIWDKNATGKPVSNTNPLIGLVESDLAPYRAHHETHHAPGSLTLDFKSATGSEKMQVGGLVADLAGAAGGVSGILGYKDSVDYLFDNSLATTDLSLNRSTPMAFEFEISTAGGADVAFLKLFEDNDIVFHLSPERRATLSITTTDPVPEPGTAALFALAILGYGIYRRRRVSG